MVKWYNMKGKKLNIKLYLIFGVLLLLIVVLIISIIFLNNKPTNEEKLNSGTISNEILTRLNLENENLTDEEGYKIGSAIVEVYSKDDKKEALGLFERVITEAYSKNNYDLFLDLISYRADLLRDNDQCEDSVRLFDAFDVDAFPVKERILYYNEAAAQYFMCDDDNKSEFYRQKINQIRESEGFKSYDD